MCYSLLLLINGEEHKGDNYQYVSFEYLEECQKKVEKCFDLLNKPHISEKDKEILLTKINEMKYQDQISAKYNGSTLLLLAKNKGLKDVIETINSRWDALPTPKDIYKKAIAFEKGIDCEPDEKQAFTLIEEAAKHYPENIKIKTKLASYLEKGFGCAQDKKQAFQIYQRAAYQHDANAQFRVGFYYLHGIGCKKDTHGAVAYFGLAAENGSANAQKLLAECLENGIGCDKTRYNKEKAERWKKTASNNTNVEEESLSSIMTDLHIEQVNGPKKGFFASFFN